MESTTEQVSVEREIEIAAAPEIVWQFLVDPGKAVAWWGASATMDARPGGGYRVEVMPGRTVRGAFVELDPPRRLVYSFGWEDGADVPGAVPPGSSTVEIELLASAGGTTLRFLHRGLPGPDSASSHGRGWDHYLELLAVVAAGGDPGPDSWRSGAM
jgi:uncharacterized protein YndB with AHSA1/START domain